MSDSAGSVASLAPLGARDSLRRQIADALRAAVVSGEMEPGAVYSAPSLAARFAVSVTPVREALLDLLKEGLVAAVPNKGFRVTEVTDAQLDEITELRALIEIPTVAGIARSITADDVDALRPLAERICSAAADDDLIAYIEADTRFHVALLELAGNARLVETVRELRAQTRLYGLSRLIEERRLLSSAQEHLELLDALAAHDSAAAAKVMQRHLGHIRGLWAVRQA